MMYFLFSCSETGDRIDQSDQSICFPKKVKVRHKQRLVCLKISGVEDKHRLSQKKALKQHQRTGVIDPQAYTETGKGDGVRGHVDTFII